MVLCSIATCKNRSLYVTKKANGISFHAFPNDIDRKIKWTEATGRPNWIPTKKSVICSRHFSLDCFYETKKKIRRLQLNAVPTLCLPPWVNSFSAPSSPTISLQTNIIETDDSKDFQDLHAMQLNAMENENSVDDFYGLKLDDTPQAMKLKCELKRIKLINVRNKRQIKRLQQSQRRYKSKIASLRSLVESLRKERDILKANQTKQE